MPLAKRVVSLLLIYCFVLTIAPNRVSGVSLPFSAASDPLPTISLQFAALTPFAPAYEFVSSLFSSSTTPLTDDEEVGKEDEGLKFRLSEAAGQPEAKPISKIASASVLSDTETQAILNRLPAIKTDPSDETDFALRGKSLPPPRTGAIVMQPFPAASELMRPDQTASGPLEVVRFSPEGDVPIAPNLSVTFSQPMVALTSQEEAARNVPVTLSPEPTGKWHWIGTKTLLFEPDTRFPMATQYQVTVPAGTKSTNGSALAQTKSWTFSTPPLTVTNFYPARATVQRRDVLMFAEFDQRIDPGTVLKHTLVQAGAAQ